MSYLQTGKDVLEYVLRRGGEDPTDTLADYYAITKQHVMRAHTDILTAAPWPWALQDGPGIISIEAKSTGTVSSIAGQTVTLSATIATTQLNKKFKLDSQGIVYRIATHTAGTAVLTLDAAYTETTTSGPFTIFQDEYLLDIQCIRPWYGWFRNAPADSIEFISGFEGNLLSPRRNFSSGTGVYKVAIIRLTTALKVRIMPWLETVATIEYEYTKRPSAFPFDGGANDVTMIPYIDNHALADMALYYLMMDKEDNRADGAFLSAQNKVEEMVKRYIGQTKPRFIPRPGASVGAR